MSSTGPVPGGGIKCPRCPHENPHIQVPTLAVQPDEKGRGHAAYDTATVEFAQVVQSFVLRGSLAPGAS